MAEYKSRLVEIIYKASGVKLSTAERLAQKIEGAGYVKLAEDQSLSKDFWNVVRNYPGEIDNQLEGEGWRKVELPE